MSARTDRPWRRPGRLRYLARRVRHFLRPPVTVVAAPAGLAKDRDVEVRMRDGVVLRVNVYRPPGPGPFPVILSAHPYGKDALPRPRGRRGRRWGLSPQFRIMHLSEPLTISSETGWEAPDPVHWTSLGYAVVNADSRGAGRSEGVGSLMSETEAEDFAELVEWAGTQPWSNGRVGLLGVSYLALSQYRVAARRPPHLAAIVPWEGFTDVYRDFMTPGGVPERGFSVVWAAMTRRRMRTTTDLATGRALHPLRDDWWTAMVPDLARIEVPMLVCASFSDHRLHSQGSWRAVLEAGSAERLVYTHRGGKWAAFYGAEGLAAQEAFLGRHLLGSGEAPPAPVRLEVRERGDEVAEVRAAQEWPIAGTSWTRLLLADEGRLSIGAEVSGGADAGQNAIARLRLRGPALAFSHVFEEDADVIGPMSLGLRIALERGGDAHLFAAVEKWRGGRVVPFEGSYGYGRDHVTDGMLRLALHGSTRGADATDTAAVETRAFDRLEPLAPRAAVDARIELGASATRFRAGDELRLTIGGRWLAPVNPFWGGFPARYEPSPRGEAVIALGGASALTIPIAR